MTPPPSDSRNATTCSIDQLLQIERVCDRYESDFRRTGGYRSVDDYLQDVPAELQQRTRVELEALFQALKQARQEADSAASSLPHRPTYLDITQLVSGAATNECVIRAGRFELHETLGSGGAGTVWKAFDRHLARWVALKIPLVDALINPSQFLAEARTIARLHHPNIVRVIDAGQDDIGCFIVCELIDGQSLSTQLKQVRYEPIEAARLVRDISDALACAHQAGIVHRDLKPQNIIIDRHQRPMVLDFGLACEWKDQATETAHRLLGTPAYMAPELAPGARGQPQPCSDVYALGVILFQLLTGELPFRGDVASILHQLARAEPPQAIDLNPSVPGELNTLCQCCLEKIPSRRLVSAAFLRDELDRFIHFKPIKSRPIGLAGRVTKWVYRNPAIASLAALVSVMTMIVVVGSLSMSFVLAQGWEREHQLRLAADNATLQAIAASDNERRALNQAIDAEKIAQYERQRAQTEAVFSEQTLQYLESNIQSVDPVNWVLHASIGPVSEAPKLVDWLDSLEKRTRSELSSQPRAQARMLDTIANAYRSAGHLQQASQLLDQAQQIRQSSIDNLPAAPLELLRHRFYRAQLLQDQSRLSEAQQELSEVLNDCSKLKDISPLFHADVEFQLGWLHCTRRQRDLGREHFQAALELRRQHCPNDSGLIKAAEIGIELCDADDQGQLVFEELQTIVSGDDRYSQIVKGYITVLAYRRLGQLDLAIDVYKSVLENLQTALHEPHPLLALAWGEYAEFCWRYGDFRQALPAIEKAIAQAQQLSPEHIQLYRAREIYGSELLRAQRFEEAEAQFDAMIQVESHLGRFSAVAHEGLVWVYLVSKRPSRAKEQVDLLLANTQGAPAFRRAWYHYAAARTEAALGNTDAQSQAQTTALQLAESLSELPNEGIWLERLSNILASAGKFQRSAELMQLAIANEQKAKPAMHPHIGDRMMTYSQILKALHRETESAQVQAQAKAIHLHCLPPGDIRTR